MVDGSGEPVETLLNSGYLERSDSVKREQEQETQASVHPGVGMKHEPEDSEFQSNRASQTGYSAVESAKRGSEHVRERDSASARKRLKTEDMW
ncbi:hypothetical protein CPC08DRAFT_707096 [Agrocybe pediades]|nr:hypothetical protein CPC08DRAFT_707096 [Agrocybe pediades]